MQGKEGLFFLDQKLAQNMINSEHVIVQWVVSSFFPFTLNFNNLCPISVRGALASWLVRSSPYADFTIPSNRTAVFQGCRNYVTNISGNFEEIFVQATCRKEKSTTHKRLIRPNDVVFPRTPCFFTRLINWLGPAIRLKALPGQWPTSK